MTTTLKSLGIAYRKAKVDLYYSSNASLSAIADYEDDLHKNLSALLDKINGEDESWVEDQEFIGTWTLATKSIDMTSWSNHRKENGGGLIFSAPTDEWEHACRRLLSEEKNQKPSSE